MKVFNTLTRKKEEFTPQNPLKVKMYACGPTVYNYVHIGNLRTFLFEDILRRWLEYNDYKVTLVKNLTDVDDKTIRDSKKEKMSLKEFTTKYTDAFFEDIDTLKIERANVYPKATEHIPEMIQLIQNLLDVGAAYKTDDGIYYSISKFKDYGKLAGINKDQLKEGASGRIKKDEYDKENASDFALWKFWDKEDGDVFWEAPFGKGRPGWHIECSAMSAKHLTKMFDRGYNPGKFETIDIHTGGVDLIFPHHQDEIAQTESCTHTPFTKYWMHAEHLLVDNKKMSKSLGNFYTLRDLLKKGYNPLAIRYLLISTHYRQKLNFTFESLEAATVAVQRINDFVLKLDEAKATKDNKEIDAAAKKAQKQFEDALNDDLEMSTALAAVFEFMNTVNKLELSKKDAKKAREFILKIDSVLGILAEEEKLPANIVKLVKQREEARASKNFKLADELRDELKKHGIAVEDTPNGQRWKRILSK